MQPTEALLVGGFVTPTDIRPYMKPRRLAIRITGLRPNANLYAFYNDVNISAYCRPITIASNGSVAEETSWTITGEIGDQLTSSAAGDISFLFYVPAETFLVGTGSLVVKDATDDTFTTRAEVAYNTFNFPQAPEDSYNTRLVQVEATTKDRLITGRNQIAGGFVNPLSWSFLVTPNMARNKEGIYASSLDLYFSAKDSTFGCVVEIRPMENGVPKASNLPLSRVRLYPDDISTTGATNVTFPGIVFLTNGKEYAISLIPDGGASNYSIHTAHLGERDTNSNSTISKDWEGKLFLPTNGSDWQAITDEYPKFKLYFAEFTETDGYATLVNKDYEFFTIANTSGTFMPGELVAQAPNTDPTGIASANTTSYTVVGIGTSFATQFSANDYCVVVNGPTEIDIIRVDSVSNNTVMALKKKPSFSNNAALIWKVPVGRVDSYNQYSNELVLIDTTSTNTAFLFITTNRVIGSDSGAYANVASINNKDVNLFQPLLSTTVVADTDLRLGGKVIGNDYSSPTETQFTIGTNLIDNRSAVVASKSNEIVFFAGGKSFSLNVQMSSVSSTLSPIVDVAVPTVMVYGNLLNNNNANENTKSGASLSRYITKTVNLKDGQDSEDISVIVSAYRPPGTEIDCYVKLLNSSDPDLFDNKDWTRMVNIANNAFSDAVNKNNFIDIQYVLPPNPSANLQIGSLSVSNASVNCTGVGTSFNTTIANGDIVLITSGGSSEVKRVMNVSNSTFMTFATNCSFTSTSANYSTLSPQKSAFKDVRTDSVKYYGSDGVAYLTFKTFAVKLVFLGTAAYLAPKSDNIRVVASI